MFSARAIVTLVDALKESAREPRSRKVEIAVSQLDGETEEGLWLMEVLDDLEAAEAKQAGDDPIHEAVGANRRRRGSACLEDASEHAFDLGDEVTDGEQTLAARAEFPATKAADGASSEDAAPRAAARR
jgi:hypothetical protein